jgi:hypothetical protein
MGIGCFKDGFPIKNGAAFAKAAPFFFMARVSTETRFSFRTYFATDPVFALNEQNLLHHLNYIVVYH